MWPTGGKGGAQNEAVKFVFQLVVDKVTTVPCTNPQHTTTSCTTYKIKQVRQQDADPPYGGQLNLCTALRLPLQGQHLQ